MSLADVQALINRPADLYAPNAEDLRSSVMRRQLSDEIRSDLTLAAEAYLRDAEYGLSDEDWQKLHAHLSYLHMQCVWLAFSVIGDRSVESSREFDAYKMLGDQAALLGSYRNPQPPDAPLAC